MKEKLSKLINSNGFYVAISIAAAVFLWFYVAFLDNGNMTVSFKGVPVIVTGEEELEDQGLIATSVNVSSIDLNITGKVSEVTRISGKDLSVSLDLSDITEIGTSVGVYQLQYTVNYPDNINSTYVYVDSASADFITVRVEKFTTKTIPITAKYNATVPEGYQAEPVEIRQENIIVSGPDSLVSRISYAFVNIELEELTDTFSAEMPFVYMSEQDEIIDSELLKANLEKVSVLIPVLMTKEVSLTVELTGKNSATDSNTTCTVNPSTIQISGSPSRIRDINEIVVATVDLTSFESSFEEEYDIVLPDDVTNVSKIESVTVNIEVSGLSTEEFTSDNISYINNTTGYKVSIVTKSLDIVVRGKRSDLKDISASDIQIKADLKSLDNATGTYSVPAVITIGDGVDAVGEYTVTVTITQS